MAFRFAKYAGEGGVRELLLIALPMIVSTSCDGAMTLIDRLFMARLGPEQMNAVMGGGLAMQTMTFFFIGLAGYSTALVARYFGAGERHNSSTTLTQAMLIVLAAWPIIIACKPLAEAAFVSMGLSAVQIGYQTQYLDIIIYGSILSMLRHTIGCYFSGIGRTGVVMFATIVAMAVNVILDYALIFGNWGFPAMGIRGAAYATTFGWLASTLTLLAVYFAKTNRRAFAVLSSFKFSKHIMGNLLRYGYPAGVEYFLVFLASALITGIFHSKGDVAATASTIMFNWDLVSYIPLIGIEISVTSLVGRYMGAGRVDTAEQSAFAGIQTGLLYALFILVLFIFIPKHLANVFAPKEYSDVFVQAEPIAVLMIRIASLYLIGQAVMSSIIGVLRGAGDTFFTMVASVISNIALLPVLHVSLNMLGLSIVIGWIFVVLGYLVFTFVIVIRFKQGKWKTITIN